MSLQRRLSRLVEDALRRAQDAGELPAFDLPEVVIEVPRKAEYGDWATPVCLQLARLAKMAPLRIAEIVANYVDRGTLLDRVEVAPPGFLNFFISPSWYARQVEVILSAGERWGEVALGQGVRVQVEYGSANPTGPLHVGFARNVVLGDTLANVLAAAGYEVQREYYINDAGSQMQRFGESLYARYAQLFGRDEPLPEEGYQGEYIIEWAKEIAEEEGDRYLHMPREEAIAALREIGLHEKALRDIRVDCEDLGIHFDRWFSERSLYQEGVFDEVMALLRERGYVYEAEGAMWFRASELGSDQDAVLIRSNGEPGYFASDIAYHYDKFIRRGFDWVIDVWGADHQGHVPRMKAMMRALGLDPDRLTLLLYQIVDVHQGGEAKRLSKRKGTLVTLREVLDQVGKDAMRFFLLQRAADSQMIFDVDLAVKQSDENPVYYVQYAHARIASILHKATELGVEGEGNPELLTHPSEQVLIRQMLRLPDVVELAARELAPHYLPYYATELATAFHAFYRDCRVLSSDPADREITLARMMLIRAVKQTLANVLRLMGVSAPERM